MGRRPGGEAVQSADGHSLSVPATLDDAVVVDSQRRAASDKTRHRGNRVIPVDSGGGQPLRDQRSSTVPRGRAMVIGGQVILAGALHLWLPCLGLLTIPSAATWPFLGGVVVLGEPRSW